MIEAYPTPKGTGVEFIGTYNDLSSLYDTMNKLSSLNIEALAEDERLLTIMSYDLRHAFRGDREVYKKNQTFGFKINWISLLYTISCLRHHQIYVALGKIDIANLLILEELTEKAMFNYDPNGYAQLKHFIGQRISVGDNLTYLVHREVANDFFSMKSGVKRFRKIPELFIKWSWGSSAYKVFEEYIKQYMEENSCNVADIDRDIDNENSIVW